MLRPFAWLLPALCAVFMLASCSAPAEEESLGFRLLDPGSEPRTPLRYDLAAFSPASMTMTMEMESVVVSDALPDGTMTTLMPPIVMTMDTTGHAMDDEGHLTVLTVLRDFTVKDREGVDPTVTQLMQDILDQVSGLTATVTMDDRGQMLSHAVDFGEMDPAMREQMGEILSLVEDMVHGFPEEAIGIGARWEEREVITMESVEMASRAVFTLVDRTENEVTLDLNLVQSGKLLSPGMPDALMNTTGGGLLTVRLDTHAQKGTMRIETKSLIHEPGDSPVEVTAIIQVTFESAP